VKQVPIRIEEQAARLALGVSTSGHGDL